MIERLTPDEFAPQPAPLAVRPEMAARMIGVSRSTIYELLDEGLLESIKIGRARLILVASLRALLASRLLFQEDEGKRDG